MIFANVLLNLRIQNAHKECSTRGKPVRSIHNLSLKYLKSKNIIHEYK